MELLRLLVVLAVKQCKLELSGGTKQRSPDDCYLTELSSVSNVCRKEKTTSATEITSAYGAIQRLI